VGGLSNLINKRIGGINSEVLGMKGQIDQVAKNVSEISTVMQAALLDIRDIKINTAK
jgi:hypothetical protein